MKIKEHKTKPEIKKPKVISPEKYDWIGEIEDYERNTIAILGDLDIADNEFGILRLQLNKKELPYKVMSK